MDKMTEEIDLLDFAKKKGWDDARLVQFMVEELGFPEGEAWLNIEILRGESSGDIIKDGE